METPRLTVSPNLRKLMDYPRFADDVPRVLILESNYWLDTSCIHAAEMLGWRCERTPVMMEGYMPRDMVAALIHRLAEFRPDFILTINFSGMDESGMFAHLFADLEIPLVTWFVDDPRTILMDRGIYATPWSIALTWDAAYASYLKSLGFTQTHTLPLAVDSRLFDGEPAEATETGCAFVANSMKNFVEHEWEWVREYPPLAAALETAFQTGRVNRRNFGTGLSAMLEPELLDSLDADQKRHTELFCFIEGTRRLRCDLVHALEPEGLLVCGDEAWQAETAHWRPYVNYTHELPDFYRACAVNLNSTSIQMPNTVNQRVFDCPAAGGFLLTDAQPVLTELFEPDTECVVYHSMEECIDKLRFYRDNPAARIPVIKAARRRILSEHTYSHRLRSIAALVRECFGS